MLDPSLAPYAPPENVIRVLERVHKNGLRGKVDADFLGQLGIGAGMTNRTIRALEFLGLTQVEDEGAPTPLLEQYIVSGEAEAEALIGEAIRKSYEIIFRAVDPAVDDRNRIHTAFKLMKPQGQWVRMVTLFLGLCQAAGMAVKEPPSNRPGKDSGVARGPRKEARLKGNGQRDSWPREGTAIKPPVTLPAAPSRTLDSALVGILGKVADLETAEDLEAWVTMFSAAFKFVKKFK